MPMPSRSPPAPWLSHQGASAVRRAAMYSRSIMVTPGSSGRAARARSQERVGPEPGERVREVEADEAAGQDRLDPAAATVVNELVVGGGAVVDVLPVAGLPADGAVQALAVAPGRRVARAPLHGGEERRELVGGVDAP